MPKKTPLQLKVIKLTTRLYFIKTSVRICWTGNFLSLLHISVHHENIQACLIELSPKHVILELLKIWLKENVVSMHLNIQELYSLRYNVPKTKKKTNQNHTVKGPLPEATLTKSNQIQPNPTKADIVWILTQGSILNNNQRDSFIWLVHLTSVIRRIWSGRRSGALKTSGSIRNFDPEEF